MDFELEYARSRALEERQAAREAACPQARERHKRLAEIFEEQARKLRSADC